MDSWLYILPTLLLSSVVYARASSSHSSSLQSAAAPTPWQGPPARLDELNLWCYECADSGDAWPACREGRGLVEVQRKLREMDTTVDRLLFGPYGARVCWRTANHCVTQSVHDIRQNSFVPGTAAGNNPRAIYTRTCTDSNRVTGTFQDGTNFDLDGAHYKRNGVTENRTVCHIENGTLFVCVTFCQTDFCNGPQWHSQAADDADASPLAKPPHAGSSDDSVVNGAVTNSKTVTAAVLLVVQWLAASLNVNDDSVYYLI